MFKKQAIVEYLFLSAERQDVCLFFFCHKASKTVKPGLRLARSQFPVMVGIWSSLRGSIQGDAQQRGIQPGGYPIHRNPSQGKDIQETP